ncbi:7-cyano-7-deazaguanine synthase [Candidatus Pacearchaeota archaeon]|nr:7-cyano-7-deazaguanine synthase [Candidatus Pacearchaeota archaeon]
MVNKRKNEKKVIVMFSGGLDSRLVIKLMQEQGFDIVALFFKLPFAGCCDKKCTLEFSKLHKINLKIFDCTKGKLFKEYLEVIKHPKYGRGAGVNPCIDCRLFMLKKAKEFADKEGIETIVTGEVLGERPMSQTKKAMDIVEKESGLKGRLLRPLSAKFFPKTKAEESGLIDRKKFYDIEGRRRQKQMELAKKFKISYPHPAGGCLLCEKALKTRFEYLLKRGMDENEIKLIGVGRHFVINDSWIILGRNEEENKIIERVGKKMELIVPDFIGPSAVILNKCDKKTKEKINELIRAYSKKASSEDRKKFDKWKL